MAKPKTTTLLWINKDHSSTSLTHSNNAEASEISTFVQRRTQDARRAERRQRPAVRHDSVAFHVAVQSTTAVPENERTQDSAMRANRANGKRLRPPQLLGKAGKLAADNLIFGSGHDPFGHAVVPITPGFYDLIAYAKDCILTGAGDCKIEAFEAPLQPFVDNYKAGTDATLANILRYKHVLHALLACYSQRLRCRAQFPFSALYEPEYYLRPALEALRSAISDGMGSEEWAKSLALSVHFMIFCTSMTRRIEESNIHVEAFAGLLPRINTSVASGSWLFDSVTSMDLINTTHLGNVPVIQNIDPGPLPESRKRLFTERLEQLKQDSRFGGPSCQPQQGVVRWPHRTFMKFNLLQFPKVDLNLEMGDALVMGLRNRQIDAKLVLATTKLLECLDVAKVIWLIHDFATRQDAEWLCKRSKSLLHDLLSLQPVLDRSADCVETCQARCLLLTLTIYVTGAYHRMLHLSHQALAERLKLALKQLMACGADLDSRMYLWIAMTGFWASYETENRDWHKRLVIGVATKLSLCTPKRLHDVMNEYLWSNTVQQYTLYEIAECCAVTVV